MIAWTSRLPAIRRLYQQIYAAAVRRLAADLSVEKNIVSLLSRNSYADRTYEPGLSDIDMSVVIEDDLSGTDIIRLLSHIDYVMSETRQRYPMLGEIPVYTRRGFMTANASQLLNMDTYAWHCEFGDDTLLDAIQGPSARTDLERLTRGVQVYLNGFHENLLTAVAAGKSRSTVALERSANKLRREIATVRTAPSVVNPGNLASFVQSILADTDRAVGAAQLKLPAHSCEVITDPGDANAVKMVPPLGDENHASFVALLSGAQSWHLLPADFTGSQMAIQLATASAKKWTFPATTWVTKRLFVFLVRHLNPLLYYRLKAGRQVRGDDLIDDIEAPSAEGIRFFFKFEALKLLKLPSGLGQLVQVSPDLVKAQLMRLNRLSHFLDRNELVVNDTATDDLACRSKWSVETHLDVMHLATEKINSHATTLIN